MNLKNNSYFLINFIFVIIIGVVLCYSYFFYPNNQPINCVYKLQTGLNCHSCGLSRAFSSFTHLKWEEGEAYNNNALNCFIFFVTQFFFRISLLIYNYWKQISPYFIWIECITSAIFFIFTFYKFLL
jgi:hypothetical protein